MDKYTNRLIWGHPWKIQKNTWKKYESRFSAFQSFLRLDFWMASLTQHVSAGVYPLLLAALVQERVAVIVFDICKCTSQSKSPIKLNTQLQLAPTPTPHIRRLFTWPEHYHAGRCCFLFCQIASATSCVDRILSLWLISYSFLSRSRSPSSITGCRPPSLAGYPHPVFWLAILTQYPFFSGVQNSTDH